NKRQIIDIQSIKGDNSKNHKIINLNFVDDIIILIRNIKQYSNNVYLFDRVRNNQQTAYQKSKQETKTHL
ncbi:hypothetical protein, partial [Sphingobacterium daejeonense]|uniref:hypothetical protein n=1 Tax=Sphingobacterium daejeonense TaxID=371142 RepID=UPI003D314327